MYLSVLPVSTGRRGKRRTSWRIHHQFVVSSAWKSRFLSIKIFSPALAFSLASNPLLSSPLLLFTPMHKPIHRTNSCSPPRDAFSTLNPKLLLSAPGCIPIEDERNERKERREKGEGRREKGEGRRERGEGGREITDVLDDEYIPTTNVHLEIENHLESWRLAGTVRSHREKLQEWRRGGVTCGWGGGGGGGGGGGEHTEDRFCGDTWTAPLLVVPVP
jgi:hypothetical protein